MAPDRQQATAGQQVLPRRSDPRKLDLTEVRIPDEIRALMEQMVQRQV